MARRRLMLSFSSDINVQALILEFGEQFNLKTGTEQLKAAEDTDWIELEVEGEDQKIDEAISWAISRGIRAETLSQETT